jgi:ribosomal protein L12E/L44/L45/RPP1/RPP2
LPILTGSNIGELLLRAGAVLPAAAPAQPATIVDAAASPAYLINSLLLIAIGGTPFLFYFILTSVNVFSTGS